MPTLKPLVSGTAINYIGQLAVFDLRDQAAPCYARWCLKISPVPVTSAVRPVFWLR